MFDFLQAKQEYVSEDPTANAALSSISVLEKLKYECHPHDGAWQAMLFYDGRRLICTLSRQPKDLHSLLYLLLRRKAECLAKLLGTEFKDLLAALETSGYQVFPSTTRH